MSKTDGPKLTFLTSAQKAKFPEYANKFVAAGLCTDEADWDTFERGAIACYRHAGLSAPKKIIRVQSPIVGALAASISNNLLSPNVAVGDAVGVAVGVAVRDAVGGAVGDAVCVAVHAAVDDAVRVAVGGAVRVAVGDAVCVAVRDAVGGAVHDAVGVAVGDAVGGAKLQWHYWLAGQFWASWQACISFFIDETNIDLSPEIRQRAKDYRDAQMSVNYWWPNSKFIIACNRPAVINRNKLGQLHCENGMAIEYRDGWGLWMLNGVKVSKEIVMTPGEQLDPFMVLKETNAEVRRELVRKIGAERLIQKMGAKVIDKRGDYELLTMDIPGMSIRPTYLKMLNPSIGVWHVEGVPPKIDTVDAALAWRDGESEYVKPVVLT